MKIGNDYDFFIYKDEEHNRTYVCLEVDGASDEELERARQLVQKYGM